MPRRLDGGGAVIGQLPGAIVITNTAAGDVACAAGTSTTVFQPASGIVFPDGGSYFLYCQGSVSALLGATAPGSLTFSIGAGTTLGGVQLGASNNAVPVSLLVNAADLFVQSFPTGVSLSVIEGTPVFLEMTCTPTGQPITVKAGSAVLFVALPLVNFGGTIT